MLSQLCSRLYCACLRVRIAALEYDAEWLEAAVTAAPRHIAESRAKVQALRVAIAQQEARHATRRK